MSYDRDSVLAVTPGLRLLPWENDSGKPCFLSTHGAPGRLARLADEIEADLKPSWTTRSPGRMRYAVRCAPPRSALVMSCGSLTAEGPVCRGRQTTTMTASAAGMTARERMGPRCRQGYPDE